MQNQNKRLKIVYCIPALYFAGGMERVLTMKENHGDGLEVNSTNSFKNLSP